MCFNEARENRFYFFSPSRAVKTVQNRSKPINNFHIMLILLIEEEN